MDIIMAIIVCAFALVVYFYCKYKDFVHRQMNISKIDFDEYDSVCYETDKATGVFDEYECCISDYIDEFEDEILDHLEMEEDEEQYDYSYDPKYYVFDDDFYIRFSELPWVNIYLSENENDISWYESLNYHRITRTWDCEDDVDMYCLYKKYILVEYDDDCYIDDCYLNEINRFCHYLNELDENPEITTYNGDYQITSNDHKIRVYINTHGKSFGFLDGIYIDDIDELETYILDIVEKKKRQDEYDDMMAEEDAFKHFGPVEWWA